MKKLLLFAFIWSSVHLTNIQAQTINTETGSAISRKDAELILNHHNKVRAEVGVKTALEWSPMLAAYAQEWAEFLASENNCRIRHRTTAEEQQKNYGENIFWGGCCDFYHPIDASIAWYEEKQDYTYGPISSSDYGKTTGHYTQMIWEKSKEVGVGVAKCADGALIVVANYYPPGNYVGEYPYGEKSTIRPYIYRGY